MTFVFDGLDPSNEAQRASLETFLGTRFEERDSLYNGGTYYRSSTDSRRKAMLRPNLDLIDMASFYPEYRKEAWILYLRDMECAPRELESALQARFPGVVLYREHESQPPASLFDEKGGKLRIIIAAIPTFKPAQIATLGLALRVEFQERPDNAQEGTCVFTAQSGLSRGHIKVFQNPDDYGEPAYPEAPLGTWLIGFYPTSRTPEEISQILTSCVDPAARVIRAPKKG